MSLWMQRIVIYLHHVYAIHARNSNQLQVVRMFIAVVTIFAICWLPYHMFYVYAYHQVSTIIIINKHQQQQQIKTVKSTQPNRFLRTLQNLSLYPIHFRLLLFSLPLSLFLSWPTKWCLIHVYTQPHITSSSSSPHLFLAFYWLAMSNSMVNPIIYYWMNRRFRHYFQQILCFCCLRLWKVEDTYLQQNSLSIERKPRLCKY